MVHLVEPLQPLRVALVGFELVEGGAQLLGQDEQVQPELVADVGPCAARALPLVRLGQHHGGHEFRHLHRRSQRRRLRGGKHGDAAPRLAPAVLVGTVLTGTELAGRVLAYPVVTSPLLTAQTPC